MYVCNDLMYPITLSFFILFIFLLYAYVIFQTRTILKSRGTIVTTSSSRNRFTQFLQTSSGFNYQLVLGLLPGAERYSLDYFLLGTLLTPISERYDPCSRICRFSYNLPNTLCGRLDASN